MASVVSNEETANEAGAVVYLVHDDLPGRESLRQLLTASAIEVASFGSAREYLQHRRTDSAACLILDLRLPDADGLELQQRISRECGPPIVFVTNHRDINDVDALWLGANN
jgi:FixJ family two-component response regulator